MIYLSQHAHRIVRVEIHPDPAAGRDICREIVLIDGSGAKALTLYVYGLSDTPPEIRLIEPVTFAEEDQREAR